MQIEFTNKQIMKKIALFALATIIAVSCAKEKFTTSNEIYFRTTFEDSTFPTDGYQILRAPDGEQADWTDVSTVATTAKYVSNNHLIPDEPQYYNENDTRAWFMAYHPSATKIATNKVNWIITGKEDIITTLAANADTQSDPSPAKLSFAHQLYQLQFVIKAANDKAINEWGKIKSISIQSHTVLRFTPSTGIFGPEDEGGKDIKYLLCPGSENTQLTTIDNKIGHIMCFPGNISINQNKVLTFDAYINIESEKLGGKKHEVKIEMYKPIKKITLILAENSLVNSSTEEANWE